MRRNCLRSDQGRSLMHLRVLFVLVLALFAAAPAEVGPEGQITLARPESTAAR